MTSRYQHIVIGGGHNGLVCAAYLARAGKSVLVLEAANDIGGAARTRELAPGASVSSGAHLLYAMPADLIRDLKLTSHGLTFSAKQIKTLSISESGNTITFDGNTIAGVSLSEEDKVAFGRFSTDMQRFATVLRPILNKIPPRISIETWSERIELAGLGWSLRKLGRFYMREFLRIIGMNFYDLLDEYFTNEQLKAAIAMDALLGSEWAARSMGSVLTYLCRQAGYSHNGATGLSLPQGGMGALSRSIASAAKAAGAEIRTGAKVKRILVENLNAVGVELDNGEQILADNVISNADPKQTFLKLVEVEHLDTGFVRRIRNIRSSGKAGKLHLVLKGAPKFNGVDASQLGSRFLVAPSLDDIELAFNPSKYKEYPKAPVLEITVPSVSDQSLVKDGQHVLSAVVQYLPYDDSEQEDANRAACLDNILNQLERHAPGIKALVVKAELLTPRDIEREFGMTGGHWHHVEMVFESFLFNRPVAALSRYAGPVGNLYLCGAGSHPGGNVMGLAGRNAAKQVLESTKGGN